ncbi:aldo/keto reductase [Paraburkholderia sediminicola]|uniref:aldo/keto reductase n=1 Tax=Paraburkholderia sediminicola TaxID=458836 RepID=UPI0038B96D4E
MSLQRFRQDVNTLSGNPHAKRPYWERSHSGHRLWHLRNECRRRLSSHSRSSSRRLSSYRLKEIAASHDRTIAQIVLRWLVQQRGVVALSRTTRIDRLAQNLAVFDFELDSADMVAIHALATADSRIVDPPGLAPL